jgi:hypothetical protein
MDGLFVPYMTIFAACWGLLAASLVVALPVIWIKVHDSVPLEEDLVFTDENVGDVMGAKPVAVVDKEERRSSGEGEKV